MGRGWFSTHISVYNQKLTQNDYTTNVKAKTIKLQVENFGNYLHHFGYTKDFLDKIPTALNIKENKTW